MSCCVWNDYQMGSGRMDTEYTCKPFGYGRCGRCNNHDYYLVRGIVDVEKMNRCPCCGGCRNNNYGCYGNRNCEFSNYNRGCCNSGCNNRCNNNFFNTYFLLKFFM